MWPPLEKRNNGEKIVWTRLAAIPGRFLGIKKNMRACIIYDPERKAVCEGVTGIRVRPDIPMSLPLVRAANNVANA